jgi:hypothetical protein
MESLLPLALLVVMSVQAVSPREKPSRTPAQQNLSSQLISAIRRSVRSGLLLKPLTNNLQER